MKVEIYHQIDPTFRAGESGEIVKVATLETDRPLPAALAEAFRATNHIDEPWWEVGNKDLQPEPGQHRSTSVGDIAVVTDRESRTTWQCGRIGWQPADPGVLRAAVDVSQTQARDCRKEAREQPKINVPLKTKDYAEAMELYRSLNTLRVPTNDDPDVSYEEHLYWARQEHMQLHEDACGEFAKRGPLHRELASAIWDWGDWRSGEAWYVEPSARSQKWDLDHLNALYPVRGWQLDGQEPPDRGSGWRSREDKGRGGHER